MKFKMFNGVKVKIVKELRTSSSYANGKAIVGIPIVDKIGTWVQIEILEGVNKGNLKPTVLENLT